MLAMFSLARSRKLAKKCGIGRSRSISRGGAFNCTQSVLPMMKNQRYGAIINMASTAGLTGTPRHAHYSAAKGRMIALLTDPRPGVGVGVGVAVGVAPSMTEYGSASMAAKEEFTTPPVCPFPVLG
jgi:NAD(P)-dependent dehydrogenase (short-subunit alcohol dehydrogenase family)